MGKLGTNRMRRMGEEEAHRAGAKHYADASPPYSPLTLNP